MLPYPTRGSTLARKDTVAKLADFSMKIAVGFDERFFNVFQAMSDADCSNGPRCAEYLTLKIQYKALIGLLSLNL